MPLTKCAECGKEISDRAQSCPYCGCPLNLQTNCTIHFYWANMKGNTYLKTTVFVDGKEVGVMKCSDYLDAYVPAGRHKIDLYFRNKCVVSETIDVQAAQQEAYYAYKQTLTSLKRVPSNSVNWSKAISRNDGDIHTPKCPTCGSTNIKKVSLFRKNVSINTFGLASGSMGKTFVCKNCGYKW